MTTVFMALIGLTVLRWIGIVRIRPDGTLRLPVRLDPWWVWKINWKNGPRTQVFRNRPGVIKWERGRLLPRRWGGTIIGLEIGDRG